MCDIGSCDMPRIFNVNKPKARKIHECCECGSAILPGELYENSSGLWDKFETYKTCLFCADTRSSAVSDLKLMSDEGIAFGELWECLEYDFKGN